MLTTRDPLLVSLTGFNVAPPGFGVTNWLENFCGRIIHKDRSPSDVILYAHGMPLVHSKCLFETRYRTLRLLHSYWFMAEKLQTSVEHLLNSRERHVIWLLRKWFDHQSNSDGRLSGVRLNHFLNDWVTVENITQHQTIWLRTFYLVLPSGYSSAPTLCFINCW